MKKSENELLCRIGAGTTMGDMVRRFWVPACLSSDLPKPGGTPVRLQVLGDKLIAYRGSDGVIGILDEFCPHRGASLALARNEDCALRCIFHGWKIARDGRLLETPNVPDDSAKKRYRARAYPVEEVHGLVWVYLGPLDPAPARPRYQWETVSATNCLAVPVDLSCNWVQALEGLVDSAHTGVLHHDVLKRLPGYINSMSSDTSAMQGNLAPRIEIERTDFGFHYGAIRALDSDGNFQVRITAYIAPFLCLIPPGGMAFMAVPRDDNATRFYNIWWSSTERLDSGPGYDKRIELWGLNPDILESTGMRAQNPSPESDIKANRFIQNRTAMEQGESFSGLPGITAEDAALSVAMGPIAPRTHEHLVESDAAVVQLRRWLLEAARAETMPAHEGTGTPAGQISAASGDLKPSQDWRELVRQHQVIDRETQRA